MKLLVSILVLWAIAGAVLFVSYNEEDRRHAEVICEARMVVLSGKFVCVSRSGTLYIPKDLQRLNESSFLSLPRF